MIDIMSTSWIILTGALVAASCALLGTFLVLRKMSLLGDALSHAVLPGIAIAFLLSGSRSILPMFLGAAAFGMITTMLVETLHKKWGVQEDASIGIVFTALFALGVVLISVYAGQVDLDQECVLYGEIAYTPWDILLWGDQEIGPRPVWILSAILLINILIITLFYKELVISSFDSGLAVSLGISASLMHYVLMGAVSLTTVAAFESVGAILVVAMFIVPGAAAYLWSDRLKIILTLAVIFGVVSSTLGYYFASIWDSSIAGAMVVVVGIIFFISLFLSPRYGIVGKLWQQLRLSLKIAQDHILLGMIRHSEVERNALPERDKIMASTGVWQGITKVAFALLHKKSLIQRDNGHISLTKGGRIRAIKLLRSHRLWETYLSQLGLPKDHLHRPADEIEHFFDEKLQEKIEGELPHVSKDPHGKSIPKEGE